MRRGIGSSIDWSSQAVALPPSPAAAQETSPPMEIPAPRLRRTSGCAMPRAPGRKGAEADGPAANLRRSRRRRSWAVGLPARRFRSGHAAYTRAAEFSASVPPRLAWRLSNSTQARCGPRHSAPRCRPYATLAFITPPGLPHPTARCDLWLLPHQPNRIVHIRLRSISAAPNCCVRSRIKNCGCWPPPK